MPPPKFLAANQAGTQSRKDMIRVAISNYAAQRRDSID